MGFGNVIKNLLYYRTSRVFRIACRAANLAYHLKKDTRNFNYHEDYGNGVTIPQPAYFNSYEDPDLSWLFYANLWT